MWLKKQFKRNIQLFKSNTVTPFIERSQHMLMERFFALKLEIPSAKPLQGWDF